MIFFLYRALIIPGMRNETQVNENFKSFLNRPLKKIKLVKLKNYLKIILSEINFILFNIIIFN